jgi:hypothetical protein
MMLMLLYPSLSPCISSIPLPTPALPQGIGSLPQLCTHVGMLARQWLHKNKLMYYLSVLVISARAQQCLEEALCQRPASGGPQARAGLGRHVPTFSRL